MKFAALLLSLLSLVFTLSIQAAERHTVVIVEQTRGTVAFYDSTDWRRQGEVRVGKNPHEVALSPDGRTAYVTNFGIQDYDETIGTPGFTVSEIDVQSMVEIRQFSTKPDLAPHGIKVRPGNERELYVNTEKPARMVVIDLDTGDVRRRFDIDAKTHNFVFSPDGSILWLMAGPSGVIAVDSTSGRVLTRHSLSSPVRGLALSADQKVLVASGKDEIELLDPSTLTVTKRFSGFGIGQILYAMPSPDGRYIIAPAVWDSTILVIDMNTGVVLRRITSGLDPVAVTFSPDGDEAYVSNARDHKLTKIDLSNLNGQHVETKEGPNGLATSATMPRSQAREKIVFSAVLPLSGREATFGREMMLGYELWKNDLNARGGIYINGRAYSIEVVYLDTISDSSQAESLAQRAVTQGTNFFLGSYGTPDNGSVARVAANAQIPFVTSAGAGRSLYQQGNRFLFGIMTPASQYLVGSIDMALNQSPLPTKAAILTSNAPAPLEDARNAALHGRERGLTAVTLPPQTLETAGLTQDPSGALVYVQGRADFAKIISALASVDADLLVMAGDLVDSIAAVRAAKSQRFTPYGLAFSVGPSVPLFASPMGLGEDANHLIGATQWSPAAQLQGTDRYGTAEAFASGFWDAYNARASYLSAGAYATGLTYENALRRADGLDPAVVRSALASTDFETFYGRIRFNETGLNETKPMYTIQLSVEGSTVRERLIWPIDAGGTRPFWPFAGWGSPAYIK